MGRERELARSPAAACPVRRLLGGQQGAAGENPKSESRNPKQIRIVEKAEMGERNAAEDEDRGPRTDDRGQKGRRQRSNFLISASICFTRHSYFEFPPKKSTANEREWTPIEQDRTGPGNHRCSAGIRVVPRVRIILPPSLAFIRVHSRFHFRTKTVKTLEKPIHSLASRVMKAMLILLITTSSVHSGVRCGAAVNSGCEHTTRDIEGWTVRVDDRLLKGEGAALGERALKLLTARLVAITIVVPEKALAKLRAVTIELDLDYGDLRIMQYHPDAGWLKGHGYSETLAKCVHIPDAEEFLSPFENHRMPWVVLHELAHAYHDQVLGFDEPRIRAAWEKFRDRGKYKSVLTSPGQMREHYALRDAKEFFAEMTESYFGSNDFYPFVAGELKQAEPEIFALLAEIWGPLPERGKVGSQKSAVSSRGG